MRIVAAIITILIAVSLTILGVVSLLSLKVGLGIVCFMIGAAAGYFVYNDYKYFFGNK